MSLIRGSEAWMHQHYGPGWPKCDLATANLKSIRIFGRDVSVHEDAVRAFMRLDHIFRENAPKYYKKLCTQPDIGTYNCRAIAGTDTASNHSFGTAIDIDWQENHRDSDPFDQPIWTEAKAAVQKVEAEGFMRWGGRYRSPDPMHFEVMWTHEELKARITKEGLKK